MIIIKQINETIQALADNKSNMDRIEVEKYIEQILQRWGSHWADSMVPDLSIFGQRELFAWRKKKKLEKRRKG